MKMRGEIRVFRRLAASVIGLIWLVIPMTIWARGDGEGEGFGGHEVFGRSGGAHPGAGSNIPAPVAIVLICIGIGISIVVKIMRNKDD